MKIRQYSHVRSSVDADLNSNSNLCFVYKKPKQKTKSKKTIMAQFVAHPNVQQLLASIWYEGLPGFRRKNMALQALEIVRIGKINNCLIQM